MIRHGSVLVETLCRGLENGDGIEDAFLTCLDHTSRAVRGEGEGGLLVCGYSDGTLVFYHTSADHCITLPGPNTSANLPQCLAGSRMRARRIHSLSPSFTPSHSSSTARSHSKIPPSDRNSAALPSAAATAAAAAVTCVSRSPDGWCLGVGTSDGEVTVLNLRGAPLAPRPRTAHSGYNSRRSSADGLELRGTLGKEQKPVRVDAAGAEESCVGGDGPGPELHEDDEDDAAAADYDDDDIISHISRSAWFPTLASHRQHAGAVSCLAWSTSPPAPAPAPVSVSALAPVQVQAKAERGGAGSGGGSRPNLSAATTESAGSKTKRPAATPPALARPDYVLYSGCKGGRVVELHVPVPMQVQADTGSRQIHGHAPQSCAPSHVGRASAPSSADMAGLGLEDPLSAMLSLWGSILPTAGNREKDKRPQTKSGKDEPRCSQIFQCSGGVKQLQCGLSEDPSLGSLRLLLISATATAASSSASRTSKSSSTSSSTSNSAAERTQLVLLQFPLSPKHAPRMRDFSDSVAVAVAVTAGEARAKARGMCACFLPSSDGVHSTGILAVSASLPASVSAGGGVAATQRDLQMTMLDTDGNLQQRLVLHYNGGEGSEWLENTEIPEVCHNIIPVGAQTHTLLLLGGQPRYGAFSVDLLNRTYGPLEPAGRHGPMVAGASVDSWCSPPRVTTLSVSSFEGPPAGRTKDKDVVTANLFSCVFSAAFAATSLSGTTNLPRKWLALLSTTQRRWRSRKTARKGAPHQLIALPKDCAAGDAGNADDKGPVEAAARVSADTIVLPLPPPASPELQQESLEGSAFRINVTRHHCLHSSHQLRSLASARSLPYSATVLAEHAQLSKPRAIIHVLNPYEGHDALPTQIMFIPITKTLHVETPVPPFESGATCHPDWLRDAHARTWLLGWRDLGYYIDEKEYPWHAAAATAPFSLFATPAALWAGYEGDTMHISGRHVHAEAFFSFKVTAGGEPASDACDSKPMLSLISSTNLNVKGRIERRRLARSIPAATNILETTPSTMKQESEEVAAALAQAPASKDFRACTDTSLARKKKGFRANSPPQPSGIEALAVQASLTNASRLANTEVVDYGRGDEGAMFVQVNSGSDSDDSDTSQPTGRQEGKNVGRSAYNVLSEECFGFEMDSEHPNPHARRASQEDRKRRRNNFASMSIHESNFGIHTFTSHALWNSRRSSNGSHSTPISGNIHYRKPIVLDDLCRYGVSAYSVAALSAQSAVKAGTGNRNNQTWNDCDGDYDDSDEDSPDNEAVTTWADVGLDTSTFDSARFESKDIFSVSAAPKEARTRERLVNRVPSSRSDLSFEDIMREKYQPETQLVVGGVIVNKCPLPNRRRNGHAREGYPFIVGGRPGSPVLEEQEVPEELFLLMERILPLADRMMDVSMRPLAALSSSVISGFWNPKPASILEMPNYSRSALWESDIMQLAREVAVTALVAPTRDLLGRALGERERERESGGDTGISNQAWPSSAPIPSSLSAANTNSYIGTESYSLTRYSEASREQSHFLSRLRRFLQMSHVFPFLATTSCFAHDEGTSVGRIQEDIAAQLWQQRFALFGSQVPTMQRFPAACAEEASQLLTCPLARPVAEILADAGIGGTVVSSQRTGKRFVRYQRRLQWKARELLREIHRSLLMSHSGK